MTPTKIFFTEWVSSHLLNYVCFISSSKNVLDWQGSQRYLSFFNTQAAIVIRAPEPGGPETIVLHLVRKLSDGRRMHPNEESHSRAGDLRGRLGIAHTYFKALSSQQNVEKSCIKEALPWNCCWTLIVVTEQQERVNSNILLDTEVCLLWAVCCENFISRSSLRKADGFVITELWEGKSALQT